MRTPISKQRNKHIQQLPIEAVNLGPDSAMISS
jgi:hypothetical protein